MNDDLRDRLDAVEQAVDADAGGFGPVIITDGEREPDDLPEGRPVVRLSPEYDPNPDR